MKLFFRSLLVTGWVFFALNQMSAAIGETITAVEAQKYIGEAKTVCGKVVGTKYSTKSKRQPTFLNLDQPYPKQIFTVLIWGADRGKFGKPPEVFFNGKDICVTGRIESYKGKPEIIVSDPGQIKMK